MRAAPALLLFAASAPLALAPVAHASPQAQEPRRPNVLFILADDLGYMDIGANNPASFYDTPSLDALAAGGMRFTQGYAACPVCSPTRASILTGKYPVRVGITDYISPGGGNQPEQWRRATPLLPAPYEDRLAHEELTLAEAFREAGYATFFAGKWHLGPEGWWPEDHGFDVNRGGITRGGPYGGDKYFSPYGNPRLEDGPDGEHLPARLGRETADFVRAHRDDPWFAMLSFYSVHTPLMAPEGLRDKYRARKEERALEAAWGTEGERRVRLVQEHAVYAGMVEAMDAAVGTVLTTLDELGLMDETIVVFFSDNGGLSTSEGHPTSNLPLRAGKGWMYEGGIREPLLVRAPGVTRAGAVSHARVGSVDFYPTLLALCGLEPRPAQHVDGHDFTAALRGEPFDRPALHWHYPHYGNQGGAPSAAIRAGDWKLIHWFEDGRNELYRIDVDPGEQYDLASRHPERAQALWEQWQAWAEAAEVRYATRRESAAVDPDAPPRLEQLDWLAGHWQRSGDGRTSEEAWLAPAGGVMLGVARAVRDGRAVGEFLRLVEEDGAIVYEARPDGQALTRFRLTRLEDRHAVWENPDHDFPRLIEYRRDGDRLHARIVGQPRADGPEVERSWTWELRP